MAGRRPGGLASSDAEPGGGCAPCAAVAGGNEMLDGVEERASQLRRSTRRRRAIQSASAVWSDDEAPLFESGKTEERKKRTKRDLCDTRPKERRREEDAPAHCAPAADDPWSFDVDDVICAPQEDARTEAARVLDAAYGITPAVHPPVVHAKKAAEIDAWLSALGTAPAGRVLVVRGPAGCGKSATLRLLCAARDIRVDDGLALCDARVPGASLSEARRGTLSLVADVSDAALAERMEASDRRVVVFDSLPHPDAAGGLAQLHSGGCSDAVLLVTAPCGESSRDDSTLEFGAALARLQRLRTTTTVSLNALAPTFLRRLGVECRGGDAAAALVRRALRLLAGGGAEAGDARDEDVGLFHGLGRVLYARGAKARVDVDALVGADPRAFHAALHANYPRFLARENASGLAAVADALSEVAAVPWAVSHAAAFDALRAHPERVAAFVVAASPPVAYRFAPMEGGARPEAAGALRRRVDDDLHAAYNWAP